MNLFRRLFRDRVTEVLTDHDAGEQRIADDRLRAALADYTTPLPDTATQRERDERLIRDAIDLELMEIALTSCDDCLFWDPEGDRPGFKPCERHEGLFVR